MAWVAWFGCGGAVVNATGQFGLFRSVVRKVSRSFSVHFLVKWKLHWEVERSRKMASEENNVAAEAKETKEVQDTKEEKPAENKQEKETKEAAEQPAAEPQPPKPVVRKTNYEKDIVYLYQFSRTPVVPSLSPYCLKVETWLRLAGLKYEVCTLYLF